METYEEIQRAYPGGEAERGLGWNCPQVADHLSQAIRDGKLSIPAPEGKMVQFKALDNFDYHDLKAFMSVKDGQGEYIPVLVRINAYDKKEQDPGAHLIGLEKRGDRKSRSTGSRYPHFLLDTPYFVTEPGSKYGLRDVMELTHRQFKDGDYTPGHMGRNSAVVPVLVNAPEKK